MRLPAGITAFIFAAIGRIRSWFPKKMAARNGKMIADAIAPITTSAMINLWEYYVRMLKKHEETN